ncbi:shikimate dehydrogenase [Puniceibacterium sp. IMCC21224]|uniref:shikimate dehydrogenase n=1 Tax=Puniceibacterium sp. IMCC21224 TaxID=1618204 RepID=UPI00065D4B2F|nr:shikimate dehydrogenase [Puniceibacterium sp. IMCC21224]KMK64998.1 shikimate dehydrogenase [Puniceibacterium sp. IMCC21224]
MSRKYALAGVMGYPVMHSLSPLMHGHWMEQQGIEGAYLFLEIPPDQLEPALRGLHPLGFAGVNVTIPHKQRAMELVDELDPVAAKIGAVSCIVVRKDGTLFGTNNDWRGFLSNLRASAPEWRGDAGPAVVIGGGGGARAICHALMQENVPQIRLVNRSRARAEDVAHALGGPITVLDWEQRHTALQGAATVVNTTSCGMVAQPELDLSLEHLDPNAVVADIVYTPLVTGIVQAARARGNTAVGGLGMLMHQGPAAWQSWFDLTPEITPELRHRMERSLGGDPGL